MYVCVLLGTRPQSRWWVVGKRVKLHLYLPPLPMDPITAWAPPPVRSAAALFSRRIIYALEWSTNHPPLPLPNMEILSSMKPVPGVKKVGNRGRRLPLWNMGGLSRVSNLLASLGHTGRKRIVSGHTLNTQTLMKTKKKSHYILNKFTILGWAAFIAILGSGLGTSAWNQTFNLLLPISSPWFCYIVTILCLGHLINLLRANLHLRTCFWRVSMCAFILGQKWMGIQVKGEHHGVAKHLPLSSLFDWFGSPKDFSLGKKVLLYELLFEILSSVHGNLRPRWQTVASESEIGAFSILLWKVQ